MVQSVSRSAIRCSRCSAPLDPVDFEERDWRDCIHCGTPSQLHIFPAYSSHVSPHSPADLRIAEGEASCFYHTEKRAVVPCDACGRYLCSLCQVEWGEHNYCPACLEAGEAQRKMPQLENGRVHYDSIALALAIGPIIVFYFMVITAPLTLFLVWRYWSQPLSLVPRTRVRFWIAGILAVLEIVAIAAGVFALIYVAGHRTGTR